MDRTTAALEGFASAYTKGSTQLFIHTTQLIPDIGRLLEQPAPSYEATLEAANRYEQIVKELTDWLGESGPRRTVLEVLTAHKGPAEDFTFLSALPGFVDRSDVTKRRSILLTMQRQLGQLQTALLRNIKASTRYMDSVQKSLTDEPAKAAP